MFRERDKLLGAPATNQGGSRAPWILLVAAAAVVAGIAFALLRTTSSPSPPLDNGIAGPGAKPVDSSTVSAQNLVEQANNIAAEAEARAMNLLEQAELETKPR